MTIRPKSTKYLRNLSHLHIDQAGSKGEALELFGREAKPHVGLSFAHPLVAVGRVIDDQDATARTRQRTQLRHRFGRSRSVMQDARSEHRVGGSGLLNA